MKRSNLLLTLLMALFVGLGAQAQTNQKIGHINADSLLQLMPETAKAQKQLQEYSQQLQKDLQGMEEELNAKVSEFQSNEKMMTSLTRQSKQQELQDLQRRIQQYSQTAQQDLQQKQQELLNPVIEKATAAVNKVAKENGYSYVLDSSPSKGTVIYAGKGDNLMPMVLKELGIEAP